MQERNASNGLSSCARVFAFFRTGGSAASSSRGKTLLGRSPWAWAPPEQNHPPPPHSSFFLPRRSPCLCRPPPQRLGGRLGAPGQLHIYFKHLASRCAVGWTGQPGAARAPQTPAAPPGAPPCTPPPRPGPGGGGMGSCGSSESKLRMKEDGAMLCGGRPSDGVRGVVVVLLVCGAWVLAGYSG